MASESLAQDLATPSVWRIGKWALICVCVSALAGAAAMYMAYQNYEASVDKLLIDPHRDYSRVPFNMVDATEYCRLKTARRYGKNLVLSYIDEHSTRLDVKTGQYKIFMFVRTGNLTDYQEEAVHCFIDPESRMLTHYRTINLHKASLMSRAAKFFER